MKEVVLLRCRNMKYVIITVNLECTPLPNFEDMTLQHFSGKYCEYTDIV